MDLGSIPGGGRGKSRQEFLIILNSFSANEGTVASGRALHSSSITFAGPLVPISAFTGIGIPTPA